MRGAPLYLKFVGGKLRIIPADAGSTMIQNICHARLQDHPRGCGEHAVHRPVLAGHLGSSPRMRGAHSVALCTSPFLRIIPADAGSTDIVIAKATQGKDHPRGCGEHSFLSYWSIIHLGSSPRMRGAHRKLQPDECVPRIIPADAGSTCHMV